MPNPPDLMHTLTSYLQDESYAAGLTGISIRRSGLPEISAWNQPGDHRHTGFLAYSITKTVIAILLMQAQQQQRLDLEMPLATWFPHLPQAQHMCLRQLLQHTAGLPDYGGLPAYHAAIKDHPHQPWSTDTLLQQSLATGLLFNPGQGWAYSNIGYLLLKQVLEQSSGESLAGLAQRHIAAPLGLTQTRICEQVSDLTNLAPAYSMAVTQLGIPKDVRQCYHPGWVAHGVVASTPSEMTCLLDALFDGRLISTSSLQQMRNQVALTLHQPPWQQPGYGLGLMIDTGSSWGTLLGHNGSGPGYRASVLHAPALQATVCVMSTLETLVAELVLFEVLAMVADGQVDSR